MRIRKLPQEITEKIAAGEVVERPASVIKELMENALDAESTRVEVTVGHTVNDLLEVRDNGTGMPPDEVQVALMRHATSKISSEEDLYRIATLGFRGEALASLAVVADLQIDTRTEDAELGVRVNVRGGEILDRQEIGMSRGTRVVVRDLFHTTPARLKFLRSRQTEQGHVLDTFLRLALSRTDVSFQLKRMEKDWIRAPAAGELKQRAAHLFGWELAEGLRPVSGDDVEYRIQGLVGPPEIHRGSKRGIFLFVNRRPIRDVMILRVLREAYRGRLPRGRTPVAILFLELPFSHVDVNAHPTKTEVQFSDPQRIRKLILRSVARAVEKESWGEGPLDRNTETTTYAAPHTPARVPSSPSGGFPVPSRPRPVSVSTHTGSDTRSETPGWAKRPETFRPPDMQAIRETADIAPPEPLFSRFQLLGQYQDTYLVCEYRDRLLLIDQHAAHERIAYEKLEEDYARQAIVKQSLLLPPVLELPPREAECVRDNMEKLLSYGLEVEAYGGMSFVVKAVPAVLQDADPGRLLRDVAEELVEQDRAVQLDRLRSHVFSRMACHSVVRAGRSLEPAEMDALLRALDRKPGLLTCPHGRPVVVGWSLQEIQKRFQRI